MLITIISLIALSIAATALYCAKRTIAGLMIDRAYGCLTRQGIERVWTRRGKASDWVFLDLDGMHDLNDQLGYAAVDARIAGSIKASCRSGEAFAGRWYSGDELVIAVPAGLGFAVAQRVMAAMNERGLSATFAIATTCDSLTATIKTASDKVQASKTANVRGVVIA